MLHARAQRWDLFCRVIDNHGDAGVCWRLARELAQHGHAVRLVIDDLSPLAWMNGGGANGVQVLPWPGPVDVGDVVIEAFGCDPPAPFVRAMAARHPAPVWINLEYLSAQSFVERSHGLASPQGNGLTKWFFFPGFTPRTGGLLRHSALMQQRSSFDGEDWLSNHGHARRPGERVVSLFCYENPALPQLLTNLARQPTLLLLTPGHVQRQVTRAPAGVRLVHLPWLSQDEFDHLLWSCDLNFVRGEDSLVRALWAGAPFVWQAYPQQDGAHWRKVDAMLGQWRAPPAVAAAWRAWNGAAGSTWALPECTADWRQATREWRDRLCAQSSLVSRLRRFALSKAQSTDAEPA